MSTFTFDEKFHGYNNRNRNHNRNNDDGNVSLTYSATSVESSDSSFARIMRVLGKNDEDSDFVMKKDGLSKSKSNTSLGGYSTDGDESQLDGTLLLQTIAGQQSGESDDDSFTMGLLFEAPKLPDLKKKKSTLNSITPQTSPASSVDTATRSPPSAPGNWKLSHEKEQQDEPWYSQFTEPWYSQCTKCFPDALEMLLPKRR